MPTVTVEATWRMSRVEINAPSENGTITGYGEFLLEQEVPDAPIFGVMPSDSITRLIDVVKTETVTAGGGSISFETVLLAMKAFLEKWRLEDEAKPPVSMLSPPPARETEVPAGPPPPQIMPVPPPLDPVLEVNPLKGEPTE